MLIIFDTLHNTFEINTDNPQPFGGGIEARLNRYGYTIPLRGVTFGISVQADGVSVLDMTLPPPGVRYSRTDQDLLATSTARWQPDQEIEVDVWCVNTYGNRYEASKTFTAPRPPQPYPSWSWDEGRWNPPVSYPDEGDWQWDEDLQDWAPWDELLSGD
jgi:hypothetical protein